MAKATYWQIGRKIDYVNAGTEKIEYGSIIPLVERIAVAGAEIPAGEKGILITEGVFEMPKAAEEVAIGTSLYYDKTNGNVTATSTNNVPAGWAVEPAGVSDGTVKIKID